MFPRYHVISPFWKWESGTIKHGLVVWNRESNTLENISLCKGNEIRWTLKGPRICIGYRDSNGRHLPCPEQRILKPRQKRCLSCATLDVSDVCARCNGSTCAATMEQREKCRNTEFVVYLAVFSDKSVKVGVTRADRVRIRWLEQGADYAGVLLRIKDGMKARKIESTIGTSHNIALQISAKRKAITLFQTIDFETAKELAETAICTMQYPEIEDKEVKLESLSAFYNLSELDARPHPWFAGSPPSSNSSLTGRIVGMKGRMLVTRNKSAFEYLDLNQLIGFEIISDLAGPVVIQSGLLDFF